MPGTRSKPAAKLMIRAIRSRIIYAFRKAGPKDPPLRTTRLPLHRHQRGKDLDRLPEMTDADVLVGRVLVVVEVHHR